MLHTKSPGRPRGANSEETRRRILDVALKHLGERGYAKATLKDISRDAGITSGAIYYYFESKPELVKTLILETHEAIESSFEVAAAAAGPSLPSKLVAVLEATLMTMATKPELARFAMAVRVDGPRYPELRVAMEQSSRTYFDFYRRLAAEALARGEVESELRVEQIADMCGVLSLGLTALAVEVSPRRHHRAIQAVERLVQGTVFTPGATARLRRHG